MLVLMSGVYRVNRGNNFTISDHQHHAVSCREYFLLPCHAIIINQQTGHR